MNHAISATLLHLKERLETLFKPLNDETFIVSISNQLSSFERLNNKPENNELILSLIHLGEDAAARNISFSSGKPAAHALRLSFVLMISTPINDHIKAWQLLEAVLRHFQEQPLVIIDGLESNIELLSISLAESNLMWSSLGGRQYPYLLYKLKGVSLES